MGLTREEKIIGRCTLIKNKNGVQTYQYEDGKIEELTGWNRAYNVSVGDKGIMVYVSTPSYGLLFFREDKKKINRYIVFRKERGE